MSSHKPAVTTIDDIMFPGHARRSEISALDAQIDAINRVLAILERPRPRLGANVIVVDGRNVDVWVEEHAGEYRASEIDYDEGRPVAMRSSIEAALHDLRMLLEDEAELPANDDIDVIDEETRLIVREPA